MEAQSIRGTSASDRRPRLGILSCPFDGSVHDVEELITVPYQRVIQEFRKHAREDVKGTKFEKRLGADSGFDAADGAGKREPDSLDSQYNDSSRDDPAVNVRPEWRRLPCGHCLPLSYVDAFLEGRASVIGLVGPSYSGKTHLLAGLGQSVVSDSVLNELGLTVSVEQVRGHWDIFKALYIAPLYEAGLTLHFTDVVSSQHTALLFELRYPRPSGSTRDSNEYLSEWVVVVDCRGEDLRPRNLGERGGYLTTADSIVLCIDAGTVSGGLSVDRSRSEVLYAPDRFEEMAEDSATSSDVFLEAIDAYGADEGDSASESPALDSPGDFAGGVIDYLTNSAVIAHRETLGRAPKPNMIVAVLKGDGIATNLEARGSELYPKFGKFLRMDAKDEVRLPTVWERHCYVSAMLVAAGFGPMLDSLARFFPHPVCVIVSSTGGPSSPSLDPTGLSEGPRKTVRERFQFVPKPRAMSSIIVNHLLARGVLDDLVEGKFGPEPRESVEAV
jgi:hypothetical protein